MQVVTIAIFAVCSKLASYVAVYQLPFAIPTSTAFYNLPPFMLPPMLLTHPLRLHACIFCCCKSALVIDTAIIEGGAMPPL